MFKLYYIDSPVTISVWNNLEDAITARDEQYAMQGNERHEIMIVNEEGDEC